MDLLSLEYFVAVVDNGGFNAAAEVLGKTQPALSRRVQQLEQRLGSRLLERGPWGIRLTSRGAVLYEGGRKLLAAARELEADTVEYTTETVRIGAAATASGTILARFLAGWIPANPRVHLVMIEDGARNMRARLENRECDLGILAAPIPEAFEHRFLARVTVTASVPAGHRLAATARPLKVTELHRERILINNAGFLSAELLQSACKLARVEPQVVYESSVGQTLASLAESGLGIAIMGDSVDLRGFRLPRRVVTDERGVPLTFDLSLAWLKDRQLSPAEQDLIERMAAQPL